MTTSIFAAEVKAATLAKIEERLDKTNGKRRERLVSLEDVLAALAVVASGEKPYCTAKGGSVANAYDYRATTTYAMAAKVGDRYFLGITTADAKSTSPGRAWSVLQPWRTGEGPRGDAAAKWAKWTTDEPTVFELAAGELDSLQD